MQLGRYLSISLFCLSLFACASPRMAQELEGGKAAFQAGYYKEALHQLLPVAVKGRPEAQYAVGYLYYYGYGAAQDSESGLFWMSKAAEQNYPPAVAALKLIHPPAVKKVENVKDEVLTAVAEQHAEKTTVLTALPKFTHGHFALQFFGAYELAAVKSLQVQLKLKSSGHVYQTTHNGKIWYILTFGNFPSASEAAATKNNLPDELLAMEPWVRKVDGLKLV